MADVTLPTELLLHMEWADALMWRAVLGTPAALADQDMRVRVHHIHAVQQAYLQIWRGEPVRVSEVESFDNMNDIMRWAATFYHPAREFFGGLRDADLRREVRIPWADELVKRFGVARPATLAQTLQQVAMHSTHHRGQVYMHLRQLGAEPPLTDLIMWIWSGQPAAEWMEVAR